MSLFGALFSGVSGLQSQGSAMGAIADNVTNINTVGYKGTSVNFRTLVTSQASTTQYSPGGVQSSPRQGIDIQGLLQATKSSTDVGINGKGFFVTNAVAEARSEDLFTYTRAGSFKVDQEGYLQNVGGSYMQGWPLTFFDGTTSAKQVPVGLDTFMKAYTRENGDKVIINDNIIDNTNLQPINLQTIGGTASPTTNLNVGANLPANTLVAGSERINSLIFDSLGNPHNITLSFIKTNANVWRTSIEQPAQSAVGVQRTQQNEVHFAQGRLDVDDVSTGTITGTISMNANGQAINIFLDPNAADDATYTAPGDVNMTVNTTGRTMSQLLDLISTSLNGALTDANMFGAAPTPPGTWARRVSGENGITFDQASSANAMTFSASITDAAGKQLVYQNAAAGYTVPVLDANFGWYNLATNSLRQSSITFSGDGTPLTFFGRDASTAPSPQHKVELIWANGAENMVIGNQKSPEISVFLGNYNTADGLTQLAGDYQLNYLQQNGAKFGNFSGVSIGQDGIVSALFDNGVTRPVFMIPLASFTNPNGLQALSGNQFIATDFSGSPTLREAGNAGAGMINAAALEASTVDLGTEFTRMITTQRAYSSAAKIITTADDMLAELLSIKR
ncbi:MAG: hypothetical protein CMG46_11690 [Candidatus Marinimicrobia bacterium]|nr:hypothetical protein [Candidatus Neomarinimicrobiota bacterium]